MESFLRQEHCSCNIRHNLYTHDESPVTAPYYDFCNNVRIFATLAKFSPHFV